MDLWVSEITVFLSAFNSPHFIYSYTLLIFILLFLFLGFDKGRLRYFIYAGLLTNLIVISHTFNLPTIFLVSGMIVLWRVIKNKSLLIRPVLNYIIYLSLIIPSLGYVFYLFFFDQINIDKAAQNTCLTGSLLLSLVSYGLLFVLAVVGIIFILIKGKKLPNRFGYLIIWAIIQTYLIYSPVVWQRRMTEGLGIAYGLLAIVAIFYLAEYLGKKYPKFFEIFKNPFLLLFPFVIFFALSNLYVYSNDFLVHGADLNTYHIYYPNEWQETFDWLDQNTDQDSFVLAHHFMGSYLAANTGMTVYIGHPIETLDYNSKKIKSNWFFSDQGTLSEKIDFLVIENLDYIVVTKYPFSLVGEDRMDRTILQNKEYFKFEFSSHDTAVYRLIKKTLPSPSCNCGR